MPDITPEISLDKVRSAVKNLTLSVIVQNCGDNPYSLAISKLYQDWFVGDYSVTMLPYWIYRSYQANDPPIIPVLASWQLIQLAAKLFDDVEDMPGSKNIHNIGIANGLIFASQLVLDSSEENKLSLQQTSLIKTRLNESALTACSGQFDDLTANRYLTDPDTWLKIAYAKTGKLFAWAAWSGAYAAGVDRKTADSLYEFGYHFGALLQVADDYTDIWGPNDDSINPISLSLPLCYAFYAGSETERAFLQDYLRQLASGNRNSRDQIKQLLIDIGAQKYLLVMGSLLRSKALEALAIHPKSTNSTQPMLKILDKVFPILSQIH